MRGLYLALAMLLIGACGPTPVPQLTASNPPVPTAVRATLTAAASPTEPAPTATTQAIATAMPTRQPNDEFWSSLQDYPLVSAVIQGPEGYLYSFYLLEDTAGFGTCRLYFFQWDGYEQSLIHKVEQATACVAANWDVLRVEAQERQALHLHGYWSDINGNGLPELTVSHYSGAVSGDEANSGEYAVYEIRAAGHVKNIVAGLRFETWPAHMVHSEAPLTLYMYAYYSFGVHDYVDMAWLYRWEDDQFVNVSQAYQHEYEKQVEETVVALQQRYGNPATLVEFEEFLRILVIYNELALPQQAGLETYLEVTDPNHWPGTTQRERCWLQIARAYPQLDFEQGRSFQINPITAIYITGDYEMLTRVVDPQRFDVSACQ
jgi:hypothetical protein